MFSHSSHVMTLANSIIGVGILAMPFCFQKCGIILSIVLLVLSNWITRVCCHYLIKTSLLTRRKSLEMLGLHAFGASGKLLAELCIIGYLIGNCVTYFVVVGDLGPQILTKIFSIDPAEHLHLRTLIMVVVTVLCILPLGMLRNVDSLSILSTASIGFYVCLMLKIVLESETHIVANDWAQKVLYWEPAGALQCLPIFSMALSCQMQLFGVFESINNQSMDKLNGIVRNATWICTLVYIAVGFFGYIAFCTHTFSGNILVNLSPSFGSDIIKIGFVLSIAFSFPLVIFPCRASINSLLYRKGLMEATNFIPEQRFRTITVFIVGLSLCVALVIPSVELVIGLVGSTIGVAICIMFPASSFRKIIRKESMERTFAQIVLVSGFCLMILGTYANLIAIDEQGSGPQFDTGQVTPPLFNAIPPLKLEGQLQNPEPPKHLVKEVLDNPSIKRLIENLEPKNIDVHENAVEVAKIANVEIPPSENPPMPPLPVDEKHNGGIEKHDLADNDKSRPKVVLKPRDAMVVPVIKNVSIVETKATEPPAIVPQIILDDKSEAINVRAQQSIDGAAIKKDEEIAAEEQKENKINVDELRKTQNELKMTKELLERTVDELKEELAKQNQETQNLVVEKFGEVAEKVEQIERKVQKDAVKTPQKPQPPQPSIEAEADVKPAEEPKPQPSLIHILTADHAEEEKKAHAGVYEPLSYKAGELLKNVNVNVPPVEQRQPLPLPLVLLRNKTQANVNATQQVEPLAHTNKTDILENVEAIRRELLQVKEAADDSKLTTAETLVRPRRDVDTNENCLDAPKFNVISGAASIGLQIESIGRDLKSVKDDEEATEKAEE